MEYDHRLFDAEHIQSFGLECGPRRGDYGNGYPAYQGGRRVESHSGVFFVASIVMVGRELKVGCEPGHQVFDSKTNVENIFMRNDKVDLSCKHSFLIQSPNTPILTIIPRSRWKNIKIATLEYVAR